MAYNELLQKAIEEAYACASPDILPLLTVEINHRTFTTPVRLLRHPLLTPEPEVFRLRLEASAPQDAGQVVEFLCVPFEVIPPEKMKDSPGEFVFKIGNVGNQLDSYLENAALEGGVLTAVFREYIQGEELTGPAAWFPGINLRNPEVDSQTGDFSVKGTVLDWIARKFGRLYTPLKYPALV